MSPAIPAAIAALLTLAAARDLAADLPAPRLSALGIGVRLPAVLLPGKMATRIERAGLAGRVSPAGILAGKLVGAAFGALVSPAFAAVVPVRLAPAVVLAGPVGGFLAPDLVLARQGRRRREAALAALPDALDLLGVGVAAGRAPELVLAEIAAATRGPLAQELAITAAELGCGHERSVALAALAARVPGPQLGALAAALDRARRLGTPLATELHDQAARLRREAASALAERAARAAPKIQLVVALLLVPSVMLMLLAALVAHAGGLLPA